MKTPDLVVLVPGFFGFDRFGTFSYFGDRVSAAIRGHLEASVRTPVPVVPLDLGPAYSLVHRQKQLLGTVGAVVRTLDGVERIHFAGHSTGGLDAELLLRERRVDGLAWTAEHEAIRRRIASVTSIAAPHFGTTLAMTDIVRWLAHPVKKWALAGAALPAAFAFAEAFPEHALSLSQLLGGSKALAAFLVKFLEKRELLVDLEPARVEALRTTNPRVVRVPVSCFVTCPLPNPDPVVEPFEAPDALFLYLTNHTAGARVRNLSAAVDDNIRRLNAPGVKRIESTSAVPRPQHDFDDTDNDAVVNSARQLIPGDELAAVVCADHADVLGHYDRRDPTFPDQVINEGVFRSGARFGDDEFFALYREVASRIAVAMDRGGVGRERTDEVGSGIVGRAALENLS
jgi:pimeloyl-ACP methyl ester carboxylesterase